MTTKALKITQHFLFPFSIHTAGNAVRAEFRNWAMLFDETNH